MKQIRNCCLMTMMTCSKCMRLPYTVVVFWFFWFFCLLSRLGVCVCVLVAYSCMLDGCMVCGGMMYMYDNRSFVEVLV